MVQALAGATIPAVLGAIGSGASQGLSALSNQSRRTTERPRVPYQADLIAAAPDNKTRNKIKKAADRDTLLYLLSQPELIGLLVIIAGIYASQHIDFSDSKATNEGLQAIATTSSVLVGLGYAGVGDLTTLLVAGMSGGVSLVDFLGLPDLPNVDFIQFLKDINPGNLFANLWGKIT